MKVTVTLVLPSTPALEVTEETATLMQSVSTRLLAGHHARVVKVGQVTGECVWRSITVRRIVEEAAAPTPTATTLDLDRVSVCVKQVTWETAMCVTSLTLASSRMEAAINWQSVRRRRVDLTPVPALMAMLETEPPAMDH